MSIARRRTRLAGAVLGMTALAALASTATATASPSRSPNGTVARAAAAGGTTGLQYWVNCEEGSDGMGTNPTISTILTGKRIVQGSARQGNTLVLDFKYTYVHVIPSPWGGTPSRVAVEDDLSCGKSLSSGNILFHTRNGKVVNP
ncbi:hypothetical protein [Streptomyces sp. TLI_146]|uniref:hypothetical protein n=1 Tax=Streptomyces sp. TLI_146 TaxID=1938858 RepID=UPI000CC2A474|nr:hypothetical protein [Streptomyces sp. TLI_146]PKV82731.1 hypothetical protein BX283_0178 [Streptomyces sp. TLI_146]